MPPRGSNEVLKALFRSKVDRASGVFARKDHIDTELLRTVSIAGPLHSSCRHEQRPSETPTKEKASGGDPDAKSSQVWAGKDTTHVT
jgi:hypothetical protein